MIKFSRKYNPYTHWEYLNEDSGDRLRIVPEQGGLITEWRCQGIEILYFDQKRFAQKNKSVRGGIPVLFPICGNLESDLLPLSQGTFTLRQHGFARNSFWNIKLLDDQLGIGLTMSDNEITRKSFPYSFCLKMEARLRNKILEIRIIIHNKSETLMPFSFGLHPYFNVHDLKKIQIIGLQPKCMNQLNMIEEETAILLNSASEGVDFISGPNKLVEIKDFISGHSIMLKQHAPMDLSVVWSDPPRKMICVEPWTSPRGSLVNGERRLTLEPGIKCELNTSISYD